ncbi:MlaD family protein [Mycobacteroides abscessus]|uniref:MlaD family protein n=1 Tax=Mycobacteroides abscessus TaxID=36809 RepID=UPI0009A799AA|nr:MlaD family protein [Mycobacteroides abscessus]SLG56323.1 Mce family protein [Mycobacteroides abscessus subsp. abscessus]
MMKVSVRARLIAVLLSAAVAAGGCGLNPVQMRIPDLTGSRNVPIIIEFTNALNLPAGSKIAYEGADVGVVRDVSLQSGMAVVRADVESNTQIPRDSTAAIVQDTVLGDSYIRLARTPGGTWNDPLPPGGRILAARTLPPTSIEDMMSTLSSFLGTGSLQQLQGAVRRINAAVPADPAVARAVASTLAVDLRSLAANSNDVDQSLEHLGSLADVLGRRANNMQDLVSDRSQQFWPKFMFTIGSVLAVIGGMGSLLSQGYWLIPLFDSVSTALEQAGVPSAPGFTNQTLLPFLLDPRIDITSVSTVDGKDRTSDTQAVLKNLGAAP